MTTETDIGRIVAGLTKAQRRALLELPEDGSPRGPVKGAETSYYCMEEIIKGDPTKQIATIVKLCFVATREKGEGRIYLTSRWAATPLGLAVRTALKEKNDVD